MKSKGILILLSVFCLTYSVQAQSQSSAVMISTEPSGAEVSLEGELTIAGLSPIQFHQELSGRYQLNIKKYGYESFSYGLLLQPGKSTNIDIALKRKTKFKAFARSFVIPGWGQTYSDHKSKGIVFFLLTAASSTAYFIADNDYKDKLERYGNINADYRTGDSVLLVEAHKDAYDAESWRRITIGAVIASWGLNLLDVLFFFPDYHGSAVVSNLSVVPDLEQDGARLIWTCKF